MEAVRSAVLGATAFAEAGVGPDPAAWTPEDAVRSLFSPGVL